MPKSRNSLEYLKLGLVQKAGVVKRLFLDWDLGKEICGMVYDTTSSNTGAEIGACVLSFGLTLPFFGWVVVMTLVNFMSRELLRK